MGVESPLPEGLAWADVVQCIDDIEARDPLVLPTDRALLETAPSVALAVDDRGLVCGVATGHGTPEGWQVNLGVPPGRRRHGVGAALLAAVAGDQPVVVIGCDAAHARVRRFLLGQGFTLGGVVFHQRWDGEVADVAPAFGTAQLAPIGEGASHGPGRPADDVSIDPVQAVALLHAASQGAWPRPALEAADVEAGLLAMRDGVPVGVLLAHREADAWELDGLAVRAEARRLGVGRALLTEWMRRAAKAGIGVCLRVAQSNEEGLGFTQNLGFWTYRTWAQFRRERPA